MTTSDRHLAEVSIAQGDPTAWFDRLYQEAAAGNAEVPWDNDKPNSLIVESIGSRRGDGKTALVVGCGFGTDAEFVASLGYETTAFDVSPTAIDGACARFPESSVNYEVEDVLALPERWLEGFDLVVESITVQSMPPWVRSAAISAIASTVTAGGTLLVVSGVREEGVEVDGPPWPLTRSEIDSFTSPNLAATDVERVALVNRWRATFVDQRSRSESRRP